MRNDYLWEGSGDPDPEIRRLEETLAVLRYQERPLKSRARRYRRWPAVAAAALVIVTLAAWRLAIHYAPPTPEVAGVEGGAEDEEAFEEKTDERNGLDRAVDAHLEQVQMLLRSFRNARFTNGYATADLAYEQHRARELLAVNRFLQKEAEAAYDPVTAELLSRIEPYLIDIAHLNEATAREHVDAIRNLMERKEIMAALQIYSRRP